MLEFAKNFFNLVVNENGCMEDTSFAETTDYDTDCIGLKTYFLFLINLRLSDRQLDRLLRNGE